MGHGHGRRGRRPLDHRRVGRSHADHGADHGRLHVGADVVVLGRLAVVGGAIEGDRDRLGPACIVDRVDPAAAREIVGAVADGAFGEGVVAGTADLDIVAGAAVEHDRRRDRRVNRDLVVPGAAHDRHDHVKPQPEGVVAGAADDLLDVLTDRVLADRRRRSGLSQIRRTAVAGRAVGAEIEGQRFGGRSRAAGIRDHVRTGAAVHEVGSGAAVEGVVAIVSQERVVTSVPGERVVANPAVEVVVAFSAAQSIVAVAGEYGVVARAGIDGVIALAAVEAIVPVATLGDVVAVVGVDVVVALATVDSVVAVATADAVVAETTGQRVVVARTDGCAGLTAEDVVVAVAAVDVVVAIRAVDVVVAGAAEDAVVPRPADHRVVAGAGVDAVVTAGGDDVVIAVAGGDHVRSWATVDAVPVRAAVDGFPGAGVARRHDEVLAVADPIVAVTAVELVGAAVPREVVDAGTAFEDVVPRPTGEPVVAGAADHVLDVGVDVVEDQRRARTGPVVRIGTVKVDVVVGELQPFGLVAVVDGVDAGPAGEGVGAAAAHHHVVAIAAIDRIVPRSGLDGVIARPAGQDVVAGGPDEVVVAGSAVDGGVAHRCNQRVAGRSADEDLGVDDIVGVAGAVVGHAVHRHPDRRRRGGEVGGVRTGAADERVVTWTIDHLVVAVAADELVDAAGATDHVIADSADEHVRPRPAGQRVIAGAAVDPRRGPGGDRRSDEIVVTAAADDALDQQHLVGLGRADLAAGRAAADPDMDPLAGAAVAIRDGVRTIAAVDDIVAEATDDGVVHVAT